MVINASPQERQGVFTLLVLRRGRAVTRADRLAALVGAVKDHGGDFATIRGVALGTLVRFHVPPRNDPYWQGGAALVDAITSKGDAAPPEGKATSQPDLALRNALLRCMARKHGPEDE